jgi:hypothetical protein
MLRVPYKADDNLGPEKSVALGVEPEFNEDVACP